MESASLQLQKFLEFQIKTYVKPNYIEIEFGKMISPEIFRRYIMKMMKLNLQN